MADAKPGDVDYYTGALLSVAPFEVSAGNPEALAVASGNMDGRGWRFVSTLDKTSLLTNRRNPLLSGLLTCGPFLKDELLAMLEPTLS